MKYISQFGIIIGISFLGEICKMLLPFPVPASIYGLCLMLFALITGVVKLNKVKEVGEFLIEVMPLMFIPAAVGLLVSWNTLKPILLPVLIIILTSTIVVMAVSGLVTQWMIFIHLDKSKKESRESSSVEDILETALENDGFD